MTGEMNHPPGTPLSIAGGLPPRREIVRAAMPKVQNGDRTNTGTIVDIMPPYGTRGIVPASPAVGDLDLADRVLFSDPRDLWYLSLPSKLTPAQVLMILRAALGGDLWQQWQLQKLMSDSWVMFRKCSHELRSTVAQVRYTVLPWHEPNKEPSRTAKRKAETVTRGLMSWRPNPFSDEKGLGGLVYHALDSVLSGVTLLEIQWQEAFGEILPRAATWVHPRQFTFSNAGKIAIWDMNYKAVMQPDPDKFLVMQYMTDSGSPLGWGLVRPLAWYWSGLVFNREWMLKCGQKFGSGFFKLYYPDGATDAELKKLENFAAESANKGWILLRKDLEDAEYHPPVSMTQENPHRTQIAEANEAAQLLLLGQTATTEGNKGSAGINNNNNTVQLGVLTSRKEELAAAVAEDLLGQLARAICRVNYDGDDTECPVIVPDMTTPMSASEKASVVGATNGANVPFCLSDYYELTGTRPPTTGAQVIVPATGKIGIIGSMQEPMEVSQPEPQPVPDALAGGPEKAGGSDAAGAGNPPEKEGDEDDEEVIEASAPPGHEFYGNQYSDGTPQNTVDLVKSRVGSTVPDGKPASEHAKAAKAETDKVRRSSYANRKGAMAASLAADRTSVAVASREDHNIAAKAHMEAATAHRVAQDMVGEGLGKKLEQRKEFGRMIEYHTGMVGWHRGKFITGSEVEAVIEACCGVESEAHVRQALRAASDKDLVNLRGLLVKAVDAGHPNGELLAVQAELNRLAQR